MKTVAEETDAARPSGCNPPAVKTPGNAGSRPPGSGSRPAIGPSDWAVPGICIFLVVLVWVVFGQTLGFGFVNYDDNLYVYQNPMVQAGLTWAGFKWAFTTTYTAIWVPFTWLSFMLNYEWFGLNAGGFHLVNVLLHTANVVLLFVLLLRLTGRLWPSAFVAALFACHPQHVESVAWVAERKDVLSAFFGLLALLAYVAYAQKRSSAERPASRAKKSVPGAEPVQPATLDARRWTLDYCLALLFFACGLMAKPMLVTLPFVFLLLDYWPLQRVPDFELRLSRWTRLVREKWPFFLLTVIACLMTAIAQKRSMAYIPAGEYPSPPLLDRMGNAAITYVKYLFQSVYPVNLAVLYPLPQEMAWGQVAGAGLLLLAISGLIWRARRRRPYLLTGWLWYLGMLVPVIGLVQESTGLQAMADRYTYLPQIGWYLMLTWGTAELCANWRHRRVVLGGLAAVILAALIYCARAQVAYWRNSETLWTHTLACTSDNGTAHTDLGSALLKKGEVDEALAQYQKAVQINPNYADAHINLGQLLADQGHTDEAIHQYHQALKIDPNSSIALNNLGAALGNAGRFDEAIENFRKAIQLNPNYASARQNLDVALARLKDQAIALTKKGRWDEAIRNFREVIRFNPNHPQTLVLLAMALEQSGRTREAVAQYRDALRLNPNLVGALNNLSWILAVSPDARLRNGPEAVQLAETACQLTDYQKPKLIGTLSAAYAEAGRFKDAVAASEKARALAQSLGEPALARKNQELLQLFKKHQPYRE